MCHSLTFAEPQAFPGLDTLSFPTILSIKDEKAQKNIIQNGHRDFAK